MKRRGGARITHGSGIWGAGHLDGVIGDQPSIFYFFSFLVRALMASTSASSSTSTSALMARYQLSIPPAAHSKPTRHRPPDCPPLETAKLGRN